MQRIAIALSLCLAAAACASPRETIALTYVPQAGERLPTASRGAIYVTAWDARGLDPRAVAARLDKDGSEIGTIRADRDVADIFRSAFETELRARGFDVHEGMRGGAHLDLKIERFFNRARTGTFSGSATADVALTATISSTPSAPTYTRRLELTGKRPSAQALGGVNDKLVLENALADAVRELTDDHAFMGALDEAASGRSAR
jgi:uncharacterized lipoprotein